MKIKDHLKFVQKSPKLKNGGFRKIRIQLENVNENSIRKFKWKFNLEMEIKVYLEIGKKVYENNGNWEITKIEECGWNEKKVVCKTARRAHSQKLP